MVFSVLAAWENRMIYREFSAAVLVSMEKKMNSTTRLIGPPPMPRNEEKIPKTRPIRKMGAGCVTIQV